MTQREFILQTLLPYKEDPTKCGYDRYNDICKYITKEGNKCAVGKHMKAGEWQNNNKAIDILLKDFTLKEILTNEAFEQKFCIATWVNIQSYHDAVAREEIDKANLNIDSLEKLLNINLNELRFL